MFRSSKIIVQPNGAAHPVDDHPASAQQGHHALNVKVSRLLLFFTRSRSGSGRQYRYAGDEEILAPLSKVVEIPNDPTQVRNGMKPQPPPLPYRLTFKSRKGSTNPWSSHKTVVYQLGFNSVNIHVKVEAFLSGLRRVFVNGEEVVREKAPEAADWVFSHFFTDQNSYNPSCKRLGTILKVIVKEDHTINLYADDFPVECLRRSSLTEKGSPPPPPATQDVETLNLSELSSLAMTIQ